MKGKTNKKGRANSVTIFHADAPSAKAQARPSVYGTAKLSLKPSTHNKTRLYE